uniref:IlvB acetolactate synthase like n=1 Tax=Otus sunia TaxID=257818 RepID=A0A8C8BBU0_9STRI
FSSSWCSGIPMDLLVGIGCAGAGLLVAALLGAAYRLGLLYQLCHKVDPRSPRHGGELVAEVLKAHGVRFLFALAGGHISPVLVASEKLGIRVVDTRHEATAVFAADAVSRLSGRIGVAAVTAGPGVTNTVTAVKNAQMAESPVLLIGGAAASLQKGRGALQDIDQLSLFRTLCKSCVSVRAVRDIVPTLRKAIATAQSGTPGPVFVELPIDVLYPFHVVEKEIGGTKSSRGLRGKAVQWYLQNYIRNLFAGAWEPRDVSPLPVKVPLATEDQVARRWRPWASPATWGGRRGGFSPPTAPSSCAKTAATPSAMPTWCCWQVPGWGVGGNGDTHSIPIPVVTPHACPQGAVCDFRLSYGRLFGRRAAVVAVNRDRVQLLRNSDVFWKPRLAVQGDAASFVVRLARSLQGYACPRDWTEGLREAERKKEQLNREKAATPTPQHLNPLDLLHRLDSLLPPESLLVADGGDFVGTAAYIVRPRRPLSWLDPVATEPPTVVWVLYGDGSLGYSLMEFDTFVRHKTPVIALVGNDACWSQISREQVALLGSNVACGLEYLDYHLVAEALGGKGFVVARPDHERLEAVLRAAQDACRQGHPVLLNALIGRTDFRDGSISV